MTARSLARIVATSVLAAAMVATLVATLVVTAGPAGARAVPKAVGHTTPCRAQFPKRAVVVDISRQRAWFCSRRRTVLTTLVTTGAVDKGDGTPTGTWHVYAKQRNTTLYPASGGAYHVHFWMPYSGPYGLHDAPWQKFRYGSPKYRLHGSHGCVHVPEKAMRFLYRWAPVGTRVTIRR